MTSWLVAVLVTVAMSSAALAQGVPVNDSGLTARDLVETADREADLDERCDFPGGGREPVPVPYEQFLDDAQIWIGGGARCGAG